MAAASSASGPAAARAVPGMEEHDTEGAGAAGGSEGNEDAASYSEPVYVRGRRYLRLYFSEVSGEVHGPMLWGSDQRVEEIQQWLEEETFESRCVDEETNDWLAHVEISTSCGMVLDLTRTLDEYPVRDGDTLTVFIVCLLYTSPSPRDRG